MAERKAFLLRVAPELLESMPRRANDDLRSLNAQIEGVLRRALQREGRPIGPTTPPTDVKSDAGSDASADVVAGTDVG